MRITRRILWPGHAITILIVRRWHWWYGAVNRWTARATRRWEFAILTEADATRWTSTLQLLETL